MMGALLHTATFESAGKTFWLFDAVALQEELALIRECFPNLGANGWLSDEEVAAAQQNHRDPLKTARFREQVARAMVYLQHCTTKPSASNPPMSVVMQKALMKRLTGVSVQTGALICAYFALGGRAGDLLGSGEPPVARGARPQGAVPHPVVLPLRLLAIIEN